MRNILYSINALFFCIVIGGAVYEHCGVVPAWTAAPPASLTMFQGEYGLDASLFWMSIHPVTMMFFVINLVLHWRTARRKSILVPLAGYVIILTTTFIYFVPELMAITETPVGSADAGLTSRANLWESLSLVRLAVLVVLAITLLEGLARNGQKVSAKNKARSQADWKPAANPALAETV